MLDWFMYQKQKKGKGCKNLKIIYTTTKKYHKVKERKR